MCNIIILNPGQMPVWSDFENMCFNNWHAFGLVTLVDGKLDIVKENFVDKEIDPKTIYNLLVKDKAYKRILHVRHITAGTNSLDNTHPFEVYYSDKRHIVFMHNGTLHTFKSKKKSEHGSYEVDDDSGPSDTKNFVDRIIQPALASMDFGYGKGDIQAPFLHTILKEFWCLDNRGILISNDQDFLLLGDWKKRKDADGGEYLSANDSYFDTVKRGPEFTRREARRIAEEEAEKSNDKTTKGSGNGKAVTPLNKYPGIGTAKPEKFRPSDKFSELLQDWDVWDRDGMASLAAMTDSEIEEFLSYKQDSVWFFNVLLEDYNKMLEELGDAKNELEGARVYVEEAEGRIADLEAICDSQKQQLRKVA